MKTLQIIVILTLVNYVMVYTTALMHGTKPEGIATIVIMLIIDTILSFKLHKELE